MAGSSLDNGPSKAVPVDVHTERIASSVDVVGACPSASGPAVTAAPKPGVLLSAPSPSTAKRRPKVEEDDPFHPNPMGLHYLWHRCAVANISFDEVLGLESPASEWLEVRHLQKILQADIELAHQRVKTYPGGSAVWLAPPGVPGEAYFVIKAWKVVYYDRAAHLLSSSDYY